MAGNNIVRGLPSSSTVTKTNIDEYNMLVGLKILLNLFSKLKFNSLTIELI